MMENETYLSQEETEQLCRLYMECQLSLLEETELHYILGKLPYSSPIIEETRNLMDIAISSHIGKIEDSTDTRKDKKIRWQRFLTVAASIAAVLTLGITLWINYDREDEYYCQVYEYGRKINRKAAVSIAENEMARIDNFIEKMIDIDRELQAKMDSFSQEQ